ncbi:endo-1,4-beta-xylanase [Streptomyces sp. 900105755]
MHNRNFRRRARVAAWDVVNEPFAEDGSYRSTIWYSASRNGTVADGSSVTVGFNAFWNGGNPVPTVSLGRTLG